MKAFGRGILPPHLDPIQRDLLIVLVTALAIAAILVSVGFGLLH
jgi:hypothetical protein